MAEAVVLHGVAVAVALADEVDHDLHLLGESQRLDLDGLARHVAAGAHLERHADGEGDLDEEGRERNVDQSRSESESDDRRPRSCAKGG